MLVAIVGAGNAGYAHACKLVEAGNKVRLVKTSQSLHEASFKTIMAKGGINAVDDTNNGRRFFAKLDMVTRDLKAAVEGTDAVFVSIQSLYHKALAERLGPLLKEGQIVIVVPGNMGTVYLKQKTAVRDVIFAEGESLPYDARIIEDGVVNILFRNVRNSLGFMPVSKKEKGLELAGRLFDTYRFFRRNIIESALHNPNLIVHTVGTVMSASRIEHSEGEFYLYKEAFTPSIWNLIEKLDLEKNNILENIGCDRLDYIDACKFRNEEDLTKDSLEVFRSYAKCGPKGPSTPNTRYIYEDVPMGLCFMSSMGDKLGIATPVCDSIINIASAMLKRDFWEEGRTLERLGLSDMTKEEILEYVTK
jgi:opine dehydrogenase